jgi:adenosylhomocysteine nucleosidase
MQTLIVVALKEESQSIFENAGYHPLYCGVGSIKATYNLTRYLSENKVGHVINLGTCGSHQFKQGQVVECVSFIQRQHQAFLPLTSKKIVTLPRTKLPAVTCGSADFVETNQPVSACDIFDMEAYSLAYVCEKFNVPFCSLKFVSDHSNENLISDWKKNLSQSSLCLVEELKKINL